MEKRLLAKLKLDFSRTAFQSLSTLTACLIAATPAMSANEGIAWSLPKVVLDTTVIYTFVDCDDSKPGGAQLKVKVAPTIIPRGLPDPTIGENGSKEVTLTELKSWTNAAKIEVKTYPGTHILSFIGVTATDKTATIVTNIFGGIAKIAALAFGVGVAAVGPEKKCGPAKAIKEELKTVQTKIADVRKKIRDNNLDDAGLKTANAQIDALTTLQTAYTNQMSSYNLTIQKTIDPGYTDIDVNNPTKPISSKPNEIDPNGLIGQITPTDEEIKGAGWYSEKTNPDINIKNGLTVSVYLDFSGALPKDAATTNKKKKPTPVPVGSFYREPAYIPVLIYRGEPIASWNSPLPAGKQHDIQQENNELNNDRLNGFQRVAFAQFGIARGMPFTAKWGEDFNWSLSFQETGELTDMSYQTAARGEGVTSTINAVLGGANSVAAEKRTADSANTETARLNAANSELDARIKNINLQQQYNALIAAPPPATAAPVQGAQGGAVLQ